MNLDLSSGLKLLHGDWRGLWARRIMSCRLYLVAVMGQGVAAISWLKTVARRLVFDEGGKMPGDEHFPSRQA